MNLFYEELPCSVTVCGKEIKIITDFREYIRLIDLLKTDEIPDSQKWPFIIQYFREIPNDMQEALDRLVEFINLEPIYNIRENSNDEEYEEKPLYSFQYDYPYILSGFLSAYGINLNSIDYMHWWEFRLLFDGLPESTEIKKRIMYRGIDVGMIKDSEEKKRIIRIQNVIRLPEYEMNDYDIGDAFA